jgi:hypothetical protein
MAKKQSPRKKTNDPPYNITKVALAVRGDPAWRNWVERLARHNRDSTLNDLVDDALIAYAKQTGFGEPAPPRIARDQAE